MEVTARNKDEAVSESSIRRDKKEWNDTVQLLIAKLLAFKKGLNGAGDDVAHLPAVDIEDPFPTEMGVYLNSIADDYIAIIEGAEEIMKDQDDYSKNAEEIPPEILAQASWWGSRAWARLGLLGLGEQRRLRLELMNLANKSYHDLYDIEDNLTGSDPDGIARAVVGMLSLMNEYTHYFIPQYNELMKEMKKRETIIEERETKKLEEKRKKEEEKKQRKQEPLPIEEEEKEEETFDPEKTQVLDPQAFDPEKTQMFKRRPAEEWAEETQVFTPGEETQGDEVYSETAPRDAWQRSLIDANNYINDNIADFERRMVSIRAANKPTDAEKTYAEKAWSDFKISHKAAQLVQIDPNSFLNERQRALIDDLYKKLRNFIVITNIIKDRHYDGWSDMQSDSSQFARQSSYKHFRETDQELEKLAHSAFTRWMNRKIMGLSSKKINRMKMVAVDQLQDIYKKLNDFMDVLEKRKASSNEMERSFSVLSRALSDIGKSIWPLGKNYFLNQSIRRKDEKGETHIRLTERQLRDLEEQSQNVLGKKAPSDVSDAVKQIQKKVAPIFNGINIELHPGGLKYNVQPLEERDSGKSYVAIIVQPNRHIIANMAARADEREFNETMLANWDKVEEYLTGRFEQRLNDKYSEKIGLPITMHILK